jgi:TonB family protein
MANSYLKPISQRQLPLFLAVSLVVHLVILFSLNKNNKSNVISINSQGSTVRQTLQVSLQEKKSVTVTKVTKPKKLKKTTKRKIVKKVKAQKKSQRKAVASSDEKVFKSFIKNYKHPIYPRVAMRRSLVGNVLLKLNINKKGHLLSVKIDKSSGYEILDISALNAAKLWTFKPLASDMEQISLKKKIVFVMKI